MIRILIKNLRYEKPKYPYQVRIDRASKVGNPFWMSSEIHRDKVCEQYENWARNNPMIKDEVRKMVMLYKQYGQLELFCWCAPKRCHGETLRSMIFEELRK